MEPLWIPITRKTKLRDLLSLWWSVKLDGILEAGLRVADALRKWGAR